MLSDRAVFVICMMVATWAGMEVEAATKEEKRAERRAKEIRYETCVQECRIKCGGKQ